MKIILTTDTHFGHEKMVELAGRPKDFEERIFKNLLSVCTYDSVLIHMGDVGFANNEKMHNRYIKPLPARKKILIKGNHDHQSNNWYLENGWDWVCWEMKDRYFGKIVLFSHLPIAYTGQYDINIHGHLHNDEHRKFEPALMAIKNDRQYLLSLEKHNYKAWDLKEIIEHYEHP